MCGENQHCLQDVEQQDGSSPRMRGKRRTFFFTCRGQGLIPAHAGKTTGRGIPSLGNKAHPRACGENSGAERTSVTFAGSSPRMRGKLERN